MSDYFDEELTPQQDGYFWIPNRETGELLPGEKRDGMLVFRADEKSVAIVVDGKGIVLTQKRAKSLRKMISDVLISKSEMEKR